MMPLTFVNGDLLESPADIRINTVNCVGVMGAGIALAFKTKYPLMFKEYQKECKAGKIQPGRLHVWQNKATGEEIINFPTKRHWRQPSQYQDVEAGLIELRTYLQARGTARVVLPALGTGHGGLDWSRVQQMIVDHLSDLEATILVFTPLDSRNSGKAIELSIQEQLLTEGITTVPASSPLYPVALCGRTTATLYVKGDLARLSRPLLAIVPSSKPESRETAATLDCVDQLTSLDTTLLIGYGPYIERQAIRSTLAKQGEVVIYIADGINHFRVRKDLRDVWDDTKVTIVSFVEPTKRWNPQLDLRAKNIAFFLAQAVLLTDPNPKWLSSIVYTEEQFVLPKIFYLSYISQNSDSQAAFDQLHATKIGRNPHHGMPNLSAIISIFDRPDNMEQVEKVRSENSSSDKTKIMSKREHESTNGRAKHKKTVVAQQMVFEGLESPVETPTSRRKGKRIKTGIP